jgi:hypothetical protein
MSDAVQTVENVVSEVKKVVQTVETAAIAVGNKVVEEVEVVEAEVVQVAKTEADLVVEEINRAAKVLYDAKQMALSIADKLKEELRQKKNQINDELKKLGVPVVMDTGFMVQKVEALPAEVENYIEDGVKSYPIAALIFSFIVGIFTGGFITWWTR